ncbi:antirepressor protein [Clostridium phage vB_CpeS-17DYC]|nr:antirepressor protein [Clostridium phage vB_CpeS-17DYC]
MKELKVFKQQEVLSKEFKIYGDIENPLFLAKDVAEWIDYSKSNGKYKVSQMVSVVDEEEKLVSTIKTPDMIQSREMTFLTEDGLYEVLMQSRKPIAKQFKKEVKKILKQIRKDGYYLTKNADIEKLEKELQIIKERNQLLSQENQALRFFDRQITGAWVKVNWDLDSLKIGAIDVPMDFVKAFISKYLNKHGQPKTDRESIQRVRFINYNLQLSMMCIKSILNSYGNFNIRKMEE